MNHPGRSALLLGTALVMGLGSSGCVANKAYREMQPVRSECTPNALKPADYPCPPERRYTLAFVEFDDVGEMFTKRSEITDRDGEHDKTELGQTISAIEQINDEKDAEPVFVVFIHGWHNNASDSTGNVWGFRHVLQSLAAELNNTPHNPPRRVMGIYIGWRGEATRLPVAKDFSFWNRKNAATRIPGAHLTDALRRITMAAKANPHARCVVVGHSFGGLVLERTLTQAMVEMILEYRDETERIERDLSASKINEETAKLERQSADEGLQRRKPDLTVLLNEAGPATEAKQFLTFLNDEVQAFEEPGNAKPENGRPLFLSLTSTGDAATHILFPVGQFLGKHGVSTRKYDEVFAGKTGDSFGETDQNHYFLHTTANSPLLVNHTVTQRGSVPPECPGIDLYPPFNLGAKTYYICGSNSDNKTPYWVMQIPTEFVPDHSTVFRPELQCLLEAFISPLLGSRSSCQPAVTAAAPPKAAPQLTLRPKQKAAEQQRRDQ